MLDKDKFIELCKDVEAKILEFNEVPGNYKKGVAFRKSTKNLDRFVLQMRAASKAEFAKLKGTSTPAPVAV